MKVDNAIIMAAGTSSRFAPLSYEKPKALIEVRGEVLIERQIRQLREAGIEEVVVGGESDRDARVLDYSWVLDLREQCKASNVNFTFRQLGTHFIKDGNYYTVKTPLLMSQARKANINVIIENKRAAYTFYS